MFLDIHTHNDFPTKTNAENYKSIFNLYPDSCFSLNDNAFYSVGIHPYFIPQETSEALKFIENYIIKNNIIAVGEIGLDRLCNTPLEKQKEIFEKQLLIAKNQNKPVIIHCVRTISEILFFIKKHNIRHCIFHNFRGKIQQMQQLLKKEAYISFGSALLNPSPTLKKSFIEAPVEKVFFETDDADVLIEDIYQKGAELKNLPVSDLSKQIYKNAEFLFNRELSI